MDRPGPRSVGRRPARLLKRHGFTLLLTAALVAVYVTQTAPALREHARIKGVRAEAELQLREQRRALGQGLLWLRGAETDPFLRERFEDAWRRSPDVPGPHVVVEPLTPEDGVEGAEPSEG